MLREMGMVYHSNCSVQVCHGCVFKLFEHEAFPQEGEGGGFYHILFMCNVRGIYVLGCDFICRWHDWFLVACMKTIVFHNCERWFVEQEQSYTYK